MLRLNTPFNMIVSGATKSGKTCWIKKLLESNVIYPPFDVVIYAYSQYQPIFEEMQATILGFQLVEGVPFAEIEQLTAEKNNCVVLDDLMLDLAREKQLIKLFTTYRHKRISNILVMQTIFIDSGPIRIAQRNTDYMAIFSAPRDKGAIRTLNTQMFPSHKNFLTSVFDEIVQKPYNYMLIDLTPHTDNRMRVRQGLFDNDQVFTGSR